MNASNTTTKAITVLERNTSGVTNYISKLNRKALKYCLPTIVFEVSAKYFKEYFKENIKHVGEYVDITVSINVLKFNGWAVTGQIENTEGLIRTGNVNKYKECICEHCNVNRFRNKSFVLQNTETLAYMCVGSTCIDDFTGALNVSRYASMLHSFNGINNFAEDLDNEFLKGGGKIYNKVEEIITVAYDMICDYGFEATSGLRPTKGFMIAKVCEIADLPTNERVVEEFNNYIAKQSGDFFQTLQDVVETGYCDFKYFGYIAAGVNAYLKSKTELQYADAHIGNVGDKKVTFEGKVISQRGFDSMYGYQNIYTILTTDNFCVVYKTATDFTKENEQVKFTATIKEHTEYKGVKQTVVTRAKMIK